MSSYAIILIEMKSE